MRKIGIVGLGVHEKVMLKAAIETASGFATGLWQCANLDQEPEIVFLDPHTPEGELALQKYAEQEDAPMLVYCSEKLEEQKRSAGLSIKPPLSYSNVLPVLRQADSIVGASLRKPLSGLIEKGTSLKPQLQKKYLQKETTEDPVIIDEQDVNFRGTVPSFIFSTEHKKIHQLIDHVIKVNKSVEISHPDFPSIRICSDREWFIFSEDLSKHASLFCTAADEFTVTDMGDEIRKQAISGHYPKPLWELVFTATLLGSEASLASPILNDDLLYLNQLPQFDKIPHSPEHISIASYMGYLSANLVTIEEDLAIEQSTIIGFSNACQAIGLLVVSGNLPNKLVQLIHDVVITKKAVEICHAEFPSIQICSSNDWFIFPAEFENYTELFQRDLNEFTIIDKGDEIRTKAFGASYPKALWRLIYTATLFATEGKLVEPLRPELRLNISRQPDFSLVPYTKEHKALANYMSIYSDTVCDIAKNTRVDLSIVIDFCNACQAINLVEKDSGHLFPLSSIEEEITVESKIKYDDLSETSGLLQSLLANMKDKK